MTMLHHPIVALSVAAICLCAVTGCKNEFVAHLDREDGVELAVDGLTRYNLIPSAGGRDAMSFTIQANRAWTLNCDSDWLSVSRNSGEPDVEYNVTVASASNPDRTAREATLLLEISSEDWSKDYVIAQRGPEGEDSHPDGYSFFSEDFGWIADFWKGDARYGMPVLTYGEDTNSPSLASLSGAAERLASNWSIFSADRLFARYEGYLMAGDGGG